MKFQVAFCTVSLALLTPVLSSADWVHRPNLRAEEPESPRTFIGPPTAAQESKAPKESNTELVVRIGHESNLNDGILGPVTYGGRVKHRFESGLTVEAGYVRLHEPGMPALKSFVDEAQLTVNFPEIKIRQRPIVIGATAWKNRMMDMYTNLGGIEVNYEGKFSINGGLYAGTATREDIMARFLGAKLGVSMPVGPIEVSVSETAGIIRIPGDPSGLGEGRYFKSALELAKKVRIFSKIPLTFTVGIEHRYFDFGSGGPTSDPRDALIIIFGTEVNFGELVDPPAAE